MQTFHHSDFLPLNQLLECKEREQKTVSLVIPARDEENTIGTIVGLIKRELMERCPLVDEIIVMDGLSSDATQEQARRAGAQVYCTDTLLSDISRSFGKGTVMWKSLAVARGDIVTFIDADIQNFSPRFIYGLIGPILQNRSILFSKAFYERPLRTNNELMYGFGGRVTEILVRPLLQGFYPAMVDIVQPLAGEYALRREVARQCRFPQGYGVDLSILLEVYRNFGIESIAQVDMEMRIHRNRPLRDLGPMAGQILQLFFEIVQEDGYITVDTPLNFASCIPAANLSGGEPDEKRILPPMAKIETLEKSRYE
jgi:glucosyl-3-phosphoglycerate synthase